MKVKWVATETPKCKEVGTSRLAGNRRQLAGDMRPIDVIAKEYVGVDEHGRIANTELRNRIIKHMMEFKALTLMQKRADRIGG